MECIYLKDAQEEPEDYTAEASPSSHKFSYNDIEGAFFFADAEVSLRMNVLKQVCEFPCFFVAINSIQPSGHHSHSETSQYPDSPPPSNRSNRKNQDGHRSISQNQW